MTTPDTPPPRRSIGRLTAFSDGVVSIAATLLVLPLVDTAANERVTGFADFFARNGDQLLVLVLSFTVILRFWLIHHTLFEDLVAFTPALFWANAAWLLSIVLIPFPTELIAGGGTSNRTTDAIYIATLLITSLAGLAMKIIMTRHPELLAPGAKHDARLGPSITAPVSIAVALVVSQVVPGAGLWSLLLLFAAIPVDRYLMHRAALRYPSH